MDSVSRWGRASIIYAYAPSALLAGLLLAVGCSSGGELPEEPVDLGPPEEDPNATRALRVPFLIDDHFVPNGCFGDANCQGDVIEIDSRACRDRVPTTQGACRRFSYRPLAKGDPGYAGFLGILFQSPQDEHEIGKVPGVTVEPGAHRLSFWAALGSGSRVVSFRAGGANNWEGETDPSLPYKDDFGVGKEVTVDGEFRFVEIDLADATYEEVISPFGWAIHSNGRTDTIELFIDDLRWE
jgi:hypothetical protein